MPIDFFGQCLYDSPIILQLNNERTSGCISEHRDDEVEVLLREKDVNPGGDVQGKIE